MFGFIRKPFRFIKRQAKTKTGKLGLTILAGVAAPHIPFVGQHVPEIVSNVLAGEMGIGALALMFLRDQKAKEQFGE